MPTVERWGYLGMEATYNVEIVINLSTENPNRGIYLERSLTTRGMFEMS